MKCRVVERNSARFVVCAEPITRVDEVLDLVSACMEHGARGVLVEATDLPEAFFALRSRFAGEFVQKLLNYGIRLAAAIEPDPARGDKFAAFVAEARHGRQFRVFDARVDAEVWLAAE